ncbi:MAG: hypothetical protein ACOX5F_03195 [Anaerovoracaceae bacterium]|jgi:hypothetical protein
MTIDGNTIDISAEMQNAEDDSANTPQAVPVWAYRATPWGGTIASDYHLDVREGYKTVKYGSYIQSLAIGVIVEAIARALGGYPLVGSAATAGIDQMASSAKAMSSPYSKTANVMKQ